MKKNGTIYVLLAALLFSIGGLCIKMIPWSAMAINGGRNLIAVPVLLLYIKLTGHKLRMNRAVIFGAVCMCAVTTLFTLANKLTTAANPILIQYTAPAFVILFLWLFFRERPKKLDVTACVLVFCGIACFVLDGLSAGNLLGNLVALVSGIGYAWVFLLNKIPGGDPLFSTILGHAMCLTVSCYAVANKLTTAANTILTQYTAPAFVILFLWFCFHERPKKLDVVACLIVFAGIACFVLDGLAAGNLAGNLIALVSGIGYAWVFLLNRIPGGDPLFSTILGHALCFFIGLPFAVGETVYTGNAVLCAVLLGVFQLGLAYIFFTTGIRTAPPVSASLVSGIEPILNPVLVALVVGETITGLSLVGGVIVFVTIMAYNVLSARLEAKQTAA